MHTSRELTGELKEPLVGRRSITFCREAGQPSIDVTKNTHSFEGSRMKKWEVRQEEMTPCIDVTEELLEAIGIDVKPVGVCGTA